MPQLKVIVQDTLTVNNITGTTNSTAFSLDGAMMVAVQCSVDVNTPSNKTFASTAVNTGNENITITSHGYPTGLKVQVSNPGTLPTGITALTDYFVISIDTNTIQLASSLANALAGTPINITAQGSGTNTVEVTALAGANVRLQVSNDASSPTIWSDLTSATNITVDGVVYLSSSMASTTPPFGNFVRIQYTLTAGSMSTSNVVVVKGLN